MAGTILLVDDHEIFRRTFRDWLGIVFPGTRLLEASSAEAALALIEHDHPHLILMDITLPGMNGLEATSRIKSTLPSTHIVMFTIHDDDSYRTHAFAAGACAYVSKQAVRTELAPTLTTLLPHIYAGGSTQQGKQ